MTWFFLAVGAYLLFAIVAMGDKALLAGPLKTPETYAASVGFLGTLLFLGIPFFGFPFPPNAWWIAMVAGASFIIALIPYYRGIRDFEVSRIVPATGGLVPIVTFLLLLFMLPEARTIDLPTGIAFFVLVLGSVLISKEKGITFSGAVLSRAFVASLFFGGSFALLKVAYTMTSFWSGLLWYQLGSIICATVIWMLSPTVREDIGFFFRKKKNTMQTSRVPFLFFGVQALSAGASLLQSAAIYVAPPNYSAFVNALQGVQYAFIVVLGHLFSKYFAGVFREKTTVNKVIGIVLIVAGVAILAFCSKGTL